MPQSEFADENPPRSYLRSRLELFLKALPSRREFWERLDKTKYSPAARSPYCAAALKCWATPALT